MRLIPLDRACLAKALPLPAPDANKLTRGKLTLIGGSGDYPGSVCLAGKAALYAGAGYVECACSEVAVPLVRAFAPSLVVRAWDGADAHVLGVDVVDPRHPKACAIGPGMVADGALQDGLVAQMIEGCAHPLVLDGGALRTVAERELASALRTRAERGAATVMTPHGGEAAALARIARIEVPDQSGYAHEVARFARSLSDAFASHVLLKGPTSFVASPVEEDVLLMDEGTPALAKAGTGDVLAGAVGALLAQGVDPMAACALAAMVHAHAGRIAAERMGVISVTAEDVLDALPAAIRSLA